MKTEKQTEKQIAVHITKLVERRTLTDTLILEKEDFATGSHPLLLLEHLLLYTNKLHLNISLILTQPRSARFLFQHTVSFHPEHGTKQNESFVRYNKDFHRSLYSTSALHHVSFINLN